MKSNRLLSLLFLLSMACAAPDQQAEETLELTKVKLMTTKGDIVLQLYNETPQHRDNFIKIVSDSILDSLLFHRVIENFMIQGGDINSKNAKEGEPLGSGGLAYTVPAEFHPDLFHKKGALAAARMDHPERASSSTQFYIVQGRKMTEGGLDSAEIRINGWLAGHYIKHDSVYSEKFDSLKTAMANDDWETFRGINQWFWSKADDYTDFEKYKIPQDQREVYKTIGGTPFLDQNYTVFGEVISGLNVVDSIAAVATDQRDRPIKDVRILDAMILEE